MKYYSKIVEFVKPYKWWLLLSLLFSFLYVIMNTASLWMVSSLISNILNPDNFSTTSNNTIIGYLEKLTFQMIGEGDSLHKLKMLCILLFLTYLFKNIFLYISEVTMAFVNNKMIMDIRCKVFKHLQFLPLSFYDNNKTGEISSIVLADGARMRMAVTDAARKLSKHPLNILFMLGMLFLINMKMTFIALLIIPAVGSVVVVVGRSIRRKTKRTSKKIAGITNIINESILGVQIVKSFVRENHQVNKFIQECKKYFKLMFRRDKLLFITTPLNDMIGVSIAVTLLWLGGNEVFAANPSMDGDNFIKFIIYLFAIMQPAKSLASVNLSIQTSVASAERVFKIMDSNPQSNYEKINKDDFKSEIKYENISFNYMDDKDVLSGISFKIEKGSTTAIVGKSGSGKSTLVSLLPRFYEIDRGELLIDNIDCSNISLNSLRELISIVPQDSFLFNDTIKNNIQFGKLNASIQEIEAAAKKANADNFINNLTDKYDTQIGERGIKLSGGQRQRISIARAMLKNSPILILDEATASLDSESEKKVHKAIDNLILNKTVIIIAHRLSTILNADNIVVMEGGKVVDMGTHRELLSKEGTYKSLYELQFENKE